MAQGQGEAVKPAVFVVDDDESVGLGLAMLLKANGFTAKAFASAERFLAETTPSAWNCGLLDVQMPGMDGLTLMDHLCGQGAPPPELLIMTGRLTDHVKRRAGAAPVSAVLAKPLDPAEVLNAVRAAIAR